MGAVCMVQRGVGGLRRALGVGAARLRGACRSVASGSRLLVRERLGQGTTEYAILVGVLVVIAIIAVVAFRGKVQELWTAISDGINSL